MNVLLYLLMGWFIIFCRCLWSRVLAVKLFLEHVCTKAAGEKSDKITIKHCMPLFMVSNVIFEPEHEISTNVVCVFSKGSDKPVHTCSLIRVFASRLNIL